MNEPDCPGTEPIACVLIEGKRYFWCTCGRSANQPYCDGSHKDTGFQPLAFTADRNGTAFLCACKRTGDRPYCDGSHARLSK